MEQVLLSGLSQYKRQSLLFNCFAAVCVLFLLVDEELGIIIEIFLWCINNALKVQLMK